MTPEERAEKLAREICVCTCYAPRGAPTDNSGPLKDGSHYANCPAENEAGVAIDIVAAIREAVMAERERCAKIIDKVTAEWESRLDEDCSSVSLPDIADAIRARTP